MRKRDIVFRTLRVSGGLQLEQKRNEITWYSLKKYAACNRLKVSFEPTLILVCAIRCKIDSVRDYIRGQVVVGQSSFA